ncbi:TetR/AcrR family transcriptional regulator [Acinetobacter sp.]|jgi:AcrR family transcriptional regulator|uniref:TetR/AcrR family transcriptional regulator n=1 Tax=Acinetobacter sp. TaxID=472 RepID=UPI002838C4E1|nr:TetR/AcrR family transcriptional regulator [Acinetobacter sp.]MDR2248373.1 TetR/AcrR family transcriptional regulator [Acinetobacter sp.]
MSNLELSSKKLHFIQTATRLFATYGFHTAGVDLIAKEAQIPKATLYNYFRSKERFIDICLVVQKERLQDQVIEMFEYDHATSALDKLKKLYYLHSDIEGPYYLLFKAIFETKNHYPNAYLTAIRYRTWLTNEIYSQLRLVKNDVSFTDAKLFLYMIEGGIIQLLGSDVAIEREKMLDYFLVSLY